MRRADRLFQIVNLLRRRRVTTARQLATRLEVSERTIYRDIEDLIRSGVPVQGEAGVGYQLTGFDLPPLMFTPDEIEALVFGARMVIAWSDPRMSKSGQSVLAKVESALPPESRHLVGQTALFAPRFPQDAPLHETLSSLREAINTSHKVRISYTDGKGKVTKRILRPLALTFWGPTWLLGAWCEKRRAFRSFRVDRIIEHSVLPEVFLQTPGSSLADYLRYVVAGEEID